MGIYRWIVAGMGLQTGRKAVEAAERRVLGSGDPAAEAARQQAAARQRKARLILVALACGVGLLLVLALIKKVFVWLLGLALLAGLGYAAYALLGPRIQAFWGQRLERRQAREARRQAEAAARGRAQKIEEELASLKRDLGGE